MRKVLLQALRSLKGEIAYSHGAVVSKFVSRKKFGNFTLFAFDKGEGLVNHFISYDARAIILEGSTEITIAGKSEILEEGRSFDMPAFIPHSFKAPGRCKVMLSGSSS